MRNLIFYCYYEKTKECQNNLQYFIDNAIYEEYDYVFILNGGTGITITAQKNITIVKRQNIGTDFHAYAHIINAITNLNDYDNFFFVNSNVCGPFIPKYSNMKWTDAYINLLKDNVKLVGSTIIIPNTYTEKTIDFRTKYNFMLPYTYVNTDIFALNKEGFQLMKDKILTQVPDLPDILLTQLILKQGWNISCLIPEYQNIDYRTLKHDINNTSINGDPNFENAYFGNTFHKYELIFTKKSLYVRKPVNSNIKMHILYHDDRSLDICKYMEKYNWVNLTYIKSTIYFESNFILELKQRANEWKNLDFIGIMTYGFKQKYCNYDIQHIANLHSDCDVITLNNYPMLPLVKHGEFCHPNFVKIWTNLLSLLGYNDTQILNQSIPVFINNYWLAKPAVLIEYILFFEKVINIFETNTTIKEWLYEDAKYVTGTVPLDKLIEISGKPYYTHHAFVLERLPCFFFWVKGYKIYHANQKIDQLLD